MSVSTNDRLYADACMRLFELHADGYKRPLKTPLPASQGSLGHARPVRPMYSSRVSHIPII